MDKDSILKSELKVFNFNIDDIEPNDNILGALDEAIIKMKNEYLINRLEVVLNNNLIELKDKITNCRTLFGARISYDSLPKDISFIIREDNEPTYEQLEQQVKKQKEVIDRILNETKEARDILNNNRNDNMLSKGCLLSYLEIVEDILKEVSE